MPIFRYEALDTTGQARTGEIESEDVARAVAQLSEQSLVILSIELVESSERTSSRAKSSTGQPSVAGSSIAGSSTAGTAAGDSSSLQVNRDYERRIDEVLKQPAELISLLEALAAEPASAGLRKQLNYLLQHLRRGTDAEHFLRDERLCFWLPIVMSVDSGQDVDARYSQWLTQVLDERTRRLSLLATFSYPLVLAAVVILLLLPICIFIVPSFQSMFSEFGLRVPPPTQMLFAIADLVNYRSHYLILALIAGVSILIAFGYVWMTKSLGTRLFGWLIAGNSVHLVAMSRLTSVLAELLELGAPLSDAVLLAGRACRHNYFRQAAQRLAVELSEPGFRWENSRVAHNFPLTLRHAFSAGEGQQPSVPLIRELSQIYNYRVSARLGRNAGASSPLIVIGVGMVIAFTIIALFMPLVSMVTSLT